MLGRHPWYQALPKDEQIRIGLYRQANVTKVGLQFEQVLIAGLMNYAFALPNGSPGVPLLHARGDRGVPPHPDVPGVREPLRPGRRRRLAALPDARAHPAAGGADVPFGFFYGVLAGEEPIDHVQKSILRAGEDMHPLLQRIMQIHVAEEARHIGFAHQYLEHRAPKLQAPHARSCRSRCRSSCAGCATRSWCRAARPARTWASRSRVVKDLYWRQPESRKMLRDLFGDVRMLAEDTGMMNRTSRQVWRLMKIDGRSSRFRSEPASAAAERPDGLRRHAVLLRRRLVRRRLPGQLHPSGAR